MPSRPCMLVQAREQVLLICPLPVKKLPAYHSYQAHRSKDHCVVSVVQIIKPNAPKSFGTEKIEEDNQASAVQFSDQRLLLLPIRSLAGTFAWVTSPYVLRRLARDLEDVQAKLDAVIPDIKETGECFITTDKSKITLNTDCKMVYLEDLDLKAEANPDTEHWAEWIAQQVFPKDTDWQQMLIERFCIVHDDLFNFMIDTSTEITARIKLQAELKTVQDGGLWYEEALPAETILSGIMLITPLKKSATTHEKIFEVLAGLTKQTIQLGGKATVGRGMCHVQLAEGK